MFFSGATLVVSKAAQHRLVRADLVGLFVPERFAHAVRQNAVPVSDRGNDPRDDVILQGKYVFRRQGTIVGVRPEMSTGNRVHELHRDAQPGPCVAKAPFHHVARAQFPARRPDINCLIHVPRRRAARDHLQVGETRQAGHDVL